MKRETSVAKKQYQKFDNAFESNKKEKDKTKNKRSCANSKLVYNNSFTFFTNITALKNLENVLLIQKEMIY